MNKTYITNKVRTQLAASLKSDGFEYIKSRQRIIKKHSMGFDVIYARVIDYNPLFWIESSIGIRINKVEDIVNQFLDERFQNPEFNHLSTTEGTSYAAMTGIDDDVEVNNEDELNNAIQDIIKVMKEKGLHFFEKHRNLENLNLYKKKGILEDTMGGAYVLTNLMQSLTLMKLCNDSDFDKLSIQYKKGLVPWAGEEEASHEVLDNLINYLRELKLPTPKLYQTEEAEFSSLMVAEPETPYKRTPRKNDL